jgi:type IV pilus assembly protein PilQ
MFKIRCNGRLMCAALLTALVTIPIAVAESVPGRDDALQGYMVAQAGTDDALATSGSYEEPTGGQSIQMSLTEPEEDVLTRAAMDKLDAEIGSLTFKETDLSDVIRFIGKKLDLNFIFDADVVKGKVTLTFRNVRVRDALNSILTAQKLAMVPDNSGIFRIVPQDRVGGKEIETRTEVIQMNWVAAEDVMKTMSPFLSDNGKMEINEESNVIIITDVPPNLVNIKDLITRIDLPERQVMIEARLVDINIGALRNLGTRWTATKVNENAVRSVTSSEAFIDSDGIYGPVGGVARTLTREDFLGGGSLGSAAVTGAGPLAALAPTRLANAGGLVPVLLEGIGFSGSQGSLSLGDTIGIFGDTYDVNMTFEALETRGIVEILANPRVTTLNNVPAQISIIEKIPYAEAVQGPSQNSTTIEIEFERAGVDINVRPIITPNGFVRMEISLSQMIFRERVGTDPLAPPRIDERNADTNVIVSSGNTVVLGGLRQIRKLEGTQAVPWLHQIPLLGWLFKSKNYDQEKTELVLMVTPRVIEEGVSLTDHEKELYDKIETQWHLPDKWMDDVSGPYEEKKKD